MNNPKFVFITGPAASYQAVNALENRVLYNCPEAYKWDKHVAIYANEILDKNEPCAIITQSSIVIDQILIRLKQNRLSVDEVAIYFCQTPDMIDDGEELIVRVDLRQHGRCRKPPRGFFEQHMEDMRALI